MTRLRGALGAPAIAALCALYAWAFLRAESQRALALLVLAGVAAGAVATRTRLLDKLPPVPEHAAEPFVGLTTDGTPVSDLFSLRDEGLDTKPIKAAADDLLGMVTPAQRSALVQPIDSDAWRMWINACDRKRNLNWPRAERSRRRK